MMIHLVSKKKAKKRNLTTRPCETYYLKNPIDDLAVVCNKIVKRTKNLSNNYFYNNLSETDC